MPKASARLPVVNLGNTGLKVSKLGFGTFDFGVPSLRISPEEGGRILAKSYRLGVNFWDTSDDYDSYPHVAAALKLVPRREVVVCTKTSARTIEEAKSSVKNSLKELGTNYIDIVLLHYVKPAWIEDSHEVLKELNRIKKIGTIKAIGLSTHSVDVVKKVTQWKELDVIMTICCRANQAIIEKYHECIPLEDGSIEDMLNATESAHNKGKGIIAMKVLGNSAPPLIKNYKASIKSIAKLSFVDALCVGMKNLDEAKKNVDVFLSG